MASEASPLNIRITAAIAELQELIRSRFPDSEFRIEQGRDEPDAVHLVVTADVEDPDVVVDLVIDRVLELQIDEGVPVHVIPLRAHGRVIAELTTRRNHSELRTARELPLLGRA